MELRTLPIALGLLSSSGVAMAQTGPGGVGDATDNVIWTVPESGVLDASGNEATNGVDVKTWSDRSGNGNDLVQSSAGNRPMLSTGVNNGYPALRFQASASDRLLATGVATADRASLWVVCSYASLNSPNPGLVQGSPTGLAFSTNSGDKSIGLWVSNAGKLWGRGIQSNGTSKNLPQNATVPPNTTSLISSIYGGSTIAQYLDGNAVGSIAYDNTLRSWTELGVGQQASEPWDGDISEVILFNTQVNSAQRIIIDNYLAAKYGLTLAANDLYVQDDPANGNYDHDVAGIGRVNASNRQTDSRGSGVVEISGATNLGNNEFLFWGHDGGTLGSFGVGDLPAGVQGRWQRNWRVSEVKSTGGSADVGDIDITFDLTGQGTVNATDLRLLVDSDKDGIFSDESPIGGASWVSGNLYRFSGVNAITDGVRFTLGTANSATTPLPIELLSFTARALPDRTVQLDWATASEHDNDRFTIQRAPDAAHWSVVGELPGAGNSFEPLTYSLKDHDPLPGTSYYRLKQTDTDGSSTYSDAVVVHMLGQQPLTIMPNPAHGSIVLRGCARPPQEVWLLSSMGTRFAAPFTADGSSITVSLEDVAPGLYLLLVDDGDRPRTAQLVVN